MPLRQSPLCLCRRPRSRMPQAFQERLWPFSGPCKIQFDAKAAGSRKIAVKLGGDADNSWAVYSPEYYPELTTEVQHYSYFFTMENETDSTARLEFNLGLDTNNVWIANVSVTQEDL